MIRPLRFSLLVIFFLPFFTLAQEKDSIVTKKPLTEDLKIVPLDTLVLDEEMVVPMDPVEDAKAPNDMGLAQFKAKTSDTYNLLDNELSARYDSLWMRELINAAPLFDEIYDEVVNLETTSTYELDLPTDTLKIRLERLNEKTPFNVAYNASLENVIKSFLTRKRDLMERMLTVSQFYFPLFEQELDNHDIP